MACTSLHQGSSTHVRPLVCAAAGIPEQVEFTPVTHQTELLGAEPGSVVLRGSKGGDAWDNVDFEVSYKVRRLPGSAWERGGGLASIAQHVGLHLPGTAVLTSGRRQAGACSLRLHRAVGASH
jgi:hypothetical protein